MDDTWVAALLAEAWGIRATSLEPIDDGMNSTTWQVQSDGARWVLKTVPTTAQVYGFRPGLEAALVLDHVGIPAGRPVLTRVGDVLVDDAGRWTALIAWVDGEPLTASEADATLVGTVLAGVHHALADGDLRDIRGLDWIDPAAPHLDIEPWLRPAVTAAVDDYVRARPDLTTGVLHGDPAPEAFLRQRDGTVGLIDWSSCCHGPLLYDVASAAMYVGPDAAPALTEAYLATERISRDELTAHLVTMSRVRWAVQADYFARRIADADLTGIDSDADNRRGLHDARRHLAPEAASGTSTQPVRP